MPLYFFSEREHGDDIVAEDEGVEFDDLETACHEAERALREIAAQAPLERKTLWMTVLDADKQIVHRAKLEIYGERCGNGLGPGATAG
jgi:hypothetical protein